jgi:hypothetical protein
LVCFILDHTISIFLSLFFFFLIYLPLFKVYIEGQGLLVAGSRRIREYPLWIVLFYFIFFDVCNIPTTHIGGITRRGRSTVFMLPPTAVKPMPSGNFLLSISHAPCIYVITTGIVSRLFNDPQRYDSDDETTGLLHKGTPVTYTTPPKPSSYLILLLRSSSLLYSLLESLLLALFCR